MLVKILLSIVLGIAVTLLSLLVAVIFGATGFEGVAAFFSWSAPIWGLIAGVWYFVTH